MWFDSWVDLARLVVAPVAYLALVATLRVTGKRTLSKLNEAPGGAHTGPAPSPAATTAP